MSKSNPVHYGVYGVLLGLIWLSSNLSGQSKLVDLVHSSIEPDESLVGGVGKPMKNVKSF